MARKIKQFKFGISVYSAISFLSIFVYVTGDDGRDIFSSTEDMKKLFVKEQKLTGNKILVTYRKKHKIISSIYGTACILICYLYIFYP